jgi:hypothetical protein
LKETIYLPTRKAVAPFSEISRMKVTQPLCGCHIYRSRIYSFWSRRSVTDNQRSFDPHHISFRGYSVDWKEFLSTAHEMKRCIPQTQSVARFQDSGLISFEDDGLIDDCAVP